MQDAYYLTDRGIRQAIERGLIAFDPPLEDYQIQPATVDLCFDSVDSMVSMDAEGNRVSWRDGEIPARHEVELLTMQSLRFQRGILFDHELRSSLRRLGCYSRGGGMSDPGTGRVMVDVINPSRMAIQLSPGDKIGQMFFSFYKCDDAIGYEDGENPDGLPSFSRFAELLALDHGWTVTGEHWVRYLYRQGLFSVGEELELEHHLVKVHAGKTAKLLRGGGTVDFSSRRSIDEMFDEVELPYTIRDGDHIMVDTKESFMLSSHIGIHFFDNAFGTRRGLTIFEDRRPYDFALGHMPDGWVDPGYEGSFSRQPKTHSPGMTIREGDVLGHGLVFFFPNGTERAYGNPELGSHYQNQKETKLTQDAP